MSTFQPKRARVCVCWWMLLEKLQQCVEGPLSTSVFGVVQRIWKVLFYMNM
jgi:hypothetical protein